MNRFKIVEELKQYFKIYELVGPMTYRIHGDRAWKFFSTDALHMLLITRKGLNRSMTINNWKWGGKFSQRGSPITWVHMDCLQEEHNPQVYLFNV